jgi:hypothetical protein
VEALTSRSDPECHAALKAFVSYLGEVKEFLLKNLKPTCSEMLKQIVYRKSYYQAIADFNTRLDRHRDDLHFELAVDKEKERTEDMLDLRTSFEFMVNMLSEAKAEDLVNLSLTFICCLIFLIQKFFICLAKY